MRGQLTEQLPEDETAEELYDQITKEKARLVKEKKIKKTKPIGDISYEDTPFELPDNWKWVYFGEIFSHNTGKALNSSNKEGNLLEYITTSNMYWDHFELDNLKKMYFKDDEIEKCTIRKGDLLICEGGDIGRSAIWPFSYEMRIQNHIHRLRPYLSTLSPVFYYYVMRLYKSINMISGQGIGLQGFSSKRVHSLVVPLPPAAEQTRIVEKIEAIFEILDRIDTLQEQYVSNQEALKSKLIDAAIQGQLTEQLPEDGTSEEIYKQIQKEKNKKIQNGKIKKTKSMPEIKEEEIPFCISNNWRWCRLEEIFNFIDYRGATPKKISEGVPFVTAKNVRQGYTDYSIKEYISEEDYVKRQSRGISHKGDLLFSTEAPMGYAAIADLERFSAGQRLITLQQYTENNYLDNKYYMYCIAARFFQKQLDEKCSGTTVKGIKASRLKLFLIPLPPLDEQQRIAKKIDELLQYCKKNAE